MSRNYSGETPNYNYVNAYDVIFIKRLADGESVILRVDHPRFREVSCYLDDLSDDITYNDFLLGEAFILGDKYIAKEI